MTDYENVHLNDEARSARFDEVPWPDLDREEAAREPAPKPRGLLELAMEAYTAARPADDESLLAELERLLKGGR